MTGQRKALIVACGEYEHDGLRRLPASAADADALRRVLGDARIGGFDVQIVRDQPAHVVKAQIEDLLADARPDDVVVLHFSGHGLKNEAGDLFFAAHDTKPNRLASTAVSADFVERGMRSSRSRRIVLLLDCCYGGAFGRGVRARAAGSANVLDSFHGAGPAEGRGRAVITASNAMEYAFEGDQLSDDHSQRPSVFTTALVEGLATGEADRDEDGWVSLNELYDYVFDRVREQSPHQTPSRDIQMQGEVYLARSRRRRIRAAPIPPDLQGAIADPNMFTRLGAVSELRTRLASTDLAVAAGAYDALADIARADIKYVAEAATAALDGAALHVPESVLHFGEVAQGSTARRTVHLEGPPLARACTVETAHSWIRTEETGDGIEVSVDTSVSGVFRGDITLKSPTGEAAVQVDVEVRGEAGRPAEPLPAEPAPVLETAAQPSHDAAPTAGVPAVQGPAIRLGLREGAGVSAIAGALLLAGSGFADYQWNPVRDTPGLFWPVLIFATVAFIGGALMFVSRTTRLIGPGFLLGGAAASTYGIVFQAGFLLIEAEGSGVATGFWLISAGNLALVLSAVLAGLMVFSSGSVGFTPAPEGWLAWLVASLGIATALVLVFRAVDYGPREGGWLAAPSVWTGVAALVLLGFASVAIPRRFGVAALAGWLGGSVALLGHYAALDQYHEADTGPTDLFGLLSLGLLVATVFFARAAPSSDRGPAQREPAGG
jgi:hypothetical protein